MLSKRPRANFPLSPPSSDSDEEFDPSRKKKRSRRTQTRKIADAVVISISDSSENEPKSNHDQSVVEISDSGDFGTLGEPDPLVTLPELTDECPAPLASEEAIESSQERETRYPGKKDLSLPIEPRLSFTDVDHPNRSGQKNQIRKTAHKSAKPSNFDPSFSPPGRLNPDSLDGLISQNANRPFEGKVIVLTGVFDAWPDRSAVETALREAGARCPSSVSGATDLLIFGPKLEDGRDFFQGKKYRDAKLRGTPCASEGDIEALLRRATGKGLRERVAPKDFGVPSSSMHQEAVPFPIESPRRAIDQSPFACEPEPSIKETPIVKNLLWSQVYIPRHSSELLANESEISKLRRWLRGFAQPLSSSKLFQRSRIAIVCGPSSSGKLTLVRLLSSEEGFEVIDGKSDLVRRSLLRGKRYIEIIDEPSPSALKKLFEESSSHPVVCVFRAKPEHHFKPFLKNCLELRFARPSKHEAIPFLQKVVESELASPNLGHQITELIAFTFESNQRDLRKTLNELQFWLQGDSSVLSDSLAISSHPSTVFEACKRLLQIKGRDYDSYLEAGQMFLFDPELMPFLIFENYLNSKTEPSLQPIDSALSSMALGAQIAEAMKGETDFWLVPSLVFAAGVRPALAFPRGPFEVRYPSTLAKFSELRRKKRLFCKKKSQFSFIGAGASLEETQLSAQIASLLPAQRCDHRAKRERNIFGFSLCEREEGLSDFLPALRPPRGLPARTGISQAAFNDF